jgi:diguanylate cyclase (GGDEF)-like protein
MTLDPRTLLFSLASLAVLIALMSLLLESTSGERAYGFKQWALASAGVGVSLVLIFFRGLIPDFFGILLANVILLFSASMCLATACKFYEVSYPWRWGIACVTLGLIGLTLWQFGNFSLAVPTVMVCIALSALLFYTAVLIVKKAKRPISFSVALFAFTLCVMAAMYCLRALTTIFAAQPTTGVINNSATQLGVLIVGALFIVSASIGFFVMVYERQRSIIEELSRRDVLTGVLVRRAFFDDAHQVIAKHPSYAVLMMDIDHFKSINDRFGHAGGDRTLAHCARLLMNAVRIDDVLGRYGGEEFCAVLPRCSLEDAEKIATTIVSQARGQNVSLDTNQLAHYTLSIGVAIHEDQEDLVATIARADAALYQAKNSGRDRVGVA